MSLSKSLALSGSFKLFSNVIRQVLSNIAESINYVISLGIVAILTLFHIYYIAVTHITWFAEEYLPIATRGFIASVFVLLLSKGMYSIMRSHGASKFISCIGGFVIAVPIMFIYIMLGYVLGGEGVHISISVIRSLFDASIAFSLGFASIVLYRVLVIKNPMASYKLCKPASYALSIALRRSDSIPKNQLLID